MRVFPSLIMLGNASDRSADFNLHTKDATDTWTTDMCSIEYD